MEKNRKSRRRKKAFHLTGIKIIVMSRDDVEKHPGFQKGMKNSDGSFRNEKMLLDLTLLSKENVIVNEKL